MDHVVARVRRRLDRVSAEVPRRLRAAGRRFSAGPIAEEEVWLTTAQGFRVYAHLHRPVRARGRLPAVVLVPGRNGAGTDFDGFTYPVGAREIAALGAQVLHFDPTGVGRSWGEDDAAGPDQQASLLAALEFVAGHPGTDRDRLGVLSISLGVAMAAPVLAREGERLGVGYLIDWEGPSDRHVITKFGQIMAPAMGHTLQDDEYWLPREAVRHVGRIPCAYLRFQSSWDHAQEGYLRHALEMVNAAVRGGRPPEVVLNDQPPGTVFDPETPSPEVFLAPGAAEANRWLLRAVQRRIEG